MQVIDHVLCCWRERKLCWFEVVVMDNILLINCTQSSTLLDVSFLIFGYVEITKGVV